MAQHGEAIDPVANGPAAAETRRSSLLRVLQAAVLEKVERPVDSDGVKELE